MEEHDRDRLSALPDNALQAILFHLKSDEAARASALSHRWRRVSASVPTVYLVDPKLRPLPYDRPVCFDQQVTSAILFKGTATPIRVLRIHGISLPRDMLNQWIIIAASSGAEEVDVTLRYWKCGWEYCGFPGYYYRRLCPFGRSKNASADFGDDVTGMYNRTPRQLFRCSTLRRLCLASWTLDLPSRGGISITLLETLCLKRIMAPDGALQQLLLSCPRLVDLTLEECPTATEVTVISARLRSFAMVCCHNARRVVLHTRRLRSLQYRGGLPRDPSFFWIADYQEVAAVTIDICEDLSSRVKHEAAPLAEHIGRFTKLTYLSLTLRPSMAYFSSEFTAAASSLHLLRHLVLKGFLGADHAVRSVVIFLGHTKNLETLTLLARGPTPPKKKNYYSDDDDSDSEGEPAGNCVDDSIDYGRLTNSLCRMNVACLGRSLKRINIAKYSGHAFDRMLARFLLSKAAALQEFSVTLSAELYPQKEEIAREFRSWRFNRRTTINCN